MKFLPTLLASSALILASGAAAQTPPAPTDGADPYGATANDQTAGKPPMDAPSDAPANAATFTDAEIDGFAAAALKIQSLGGDAATKQQQMTEIVAQSGIDTETFNAISQAMQTDADLAKRVQVAAAKLQQKSTG